MNKKTIYIIIVILVVIIGGAVAYVLLRPSASQDSSAEVTNQPAVTTPEETPEQTEQKPAETTVQKEGQYVNYDGKAIETTEGRKLIFFHAAWCPQCRALEQSILDGTIPSGVTIFKANYDLETAIRQKYGVTLQTTLVEVDDQGNKVKSFVAYDDPSLKAVIDAFGL